jgi:hypothetical protein
VSMILAGCDPGAQGALALLDAETCRVVAIIDMPMSGSELRVRELVMDIEGTLDGRRVGSLFVEKQAPFAGAGRSIGASSAFNIGQRFMAIKAIAACFGWPTEIVPPAKWQRHFGIPKADKERSLALAEQLMPEDCGLWKPRRGYCTKAQTIGRAEAALIGLFGIRTLAGLHASVRERAVELRAQAATEYPLAETIRDMPRDTLETMIDEAAE